MNYTEDVDLSGYADIEKITINDPGYPEKLKYITNPPQTLYFKGLTPDFKNPIVAIIGARMCSPYGQQIASELGKKLALNEVTIVSGMAKGIDGIAQLAAINSGGYSIGVLGCGVDICYPKSNKQLYEKLSDVGTIISEYKPGSPPLANLFPARNRIISALCDALVVVEAKTNSGTLITTDFALEQGKNIYVIPGRIGDELSTGCLSLINQGAKVITNIDKFIKEFTKEHKINYEYKVLNEKPNPLLGSLSKIEINTYKALDFRPKTINDLKEILKYPTDKIQDALITLQLSGIIKEISKGYFVKK